MLSLFKHFSLIIFRNIFSKKFLFTFFAISLVLNFFPISTIFADTVIPTPVVDQPSAPCSLYNEDWGSSAKGSAVGGGLYKTNNIDPKDSIKELYANLGKDPLFMSTDFTANSEKDPIIGFNSNNNTIDKQSVMLPCSLGKVTGIITRRKLDVQQSNCSFNAQKLANTTNNAVSSFVNCKEDNQISGKTVGGCPINMLFVPGLLSFAGGDTGNVNESKQITLKVIYAPASFLKKTINFNTDFSTKNMATAMVNYGTTAVFDNLGSDSLEVQPVISWPDDDASYKTLMSRVVYPTDASGKADLNNKMDMSKFVYQGLKDSSNIRNIALPRDLGPQDIGVWADVGGNDGNSAGVQSFTLRGDTSKNEIKGIYYNNGETLARSLSSSGFICNTRPVTLSYYSPSDNKTTKIGTINLYEWIPSSVNQFTIPTCEQVSSIGTDGKVTSSTKIVEYPSAVNGKKYLACTPCIVASIFQTDIFNRPVLGIPTGIGCLPTSLNGLITVVLRIATMTAGGIALLLIVISGIRIALNSGNPEEIKKAQKGINAAVVGLLVIVSSVLLLNIIGVKVLGLDTFGANEINYVTTGTSTT